jgi:hypothetical protein
LDLVDFVAILGVAFATHGSFRRLAPAALQLRW